MKIKITKLKCKRCGHEWIARLEKKPEQCPKCKSYNYQDKPNPTKAQQDKSRQVRPSQDKAKPNTS